MMVMGPLNLIQPVKIRRHKTMELRQITLPLKGIKRVQTVIRRVQRVTRQIQTAIKQAKMVTRLQAKIALMAQGWKIIAPILHQFAKAKRNAAQSLLTI